ncbi:MULTISPECIES: SDR family oxidoreductase [Kocuria]|jgi:NAD(P)-dependent dehydrogenase (short-subunit alcohol dehydrogenase family)|uniref:SDR family oxidoreductase n=1 Tax=Kocuria TaxID=57493 RepID=UPI0020402E94|nr:MULTISPECIES: SDR family oxidoreductase [Kocuria]MCM3687346.1 SDR family oxidoreductase [Kocuria rosea]HST72119.1 SDR family oxidoreductase [Kocuria rosea]
MGSTGRNKVAVVTGAGSGIGRAVARSFLAEGWTVVLGGRRREALEETAAGAAGAHVVPVDVADPASVASAFRDVERLTGRIDVLFNNAGTFGPRGEADEIDVEDWQRTLQVNLTGTFLCSAEAFRIMKAQEPRGGRIINNGSISAHAPRPLSAAYTASKHAVTGLTKSLDLDGRAYGISCGQIDIGNAATELLAGLGTGDGALQADGSLRPEPSFPVEEVGRAVLLMAQLPASATVNSLVLTAAGMPFLGRG